MANVAVAFAVSIGITSVVGAVCGFVFGGIGGRVAMRAVLLTSDDRVRGLTSDDGFEIGTISAATVFLLVITTILGGIAGFVAGIVRMVTAGPTWVVAPATGIATAAFGGAALVHADGIDFRLLGPLWLTVGLFVLIPGLWGVSVVAVTEGLLRSRLLVDLPAHVHSRVWGATGWILLTALTVTGTRGLISDITALT